MQMHECVKEDIINDLVTGVELLRQSNESQMIMLEKIDSKTDKIIWFLLGVTTAICTSLIIYLV